MEDGHPTDREKLTKLDQPDAETQPPDARNPDRSSPVAGISPNQPSPATGCASRSSCWYNRNPEQRPVLHDAGQPQHGHSWRVGKGVGLHHKDRTRFAIITINGNRHQITTFHAVYPSRKSSSSKSASSARKTRASSLAGAHASTATSRDCRRASASKARRSRPAT